MHLHGFIVVNLAGKLVIKHQEESDCVRNIGSDPSVFKDRVGPRHFALEL